MPQVDEKSEMQSIIALAQRFVRTPEGAALYGVPIGSKIGDAELDKNAQDRPVTIERLRSLMRQFEAAKKVGDSALMGQVQSSFIQDLRKFRKSHPQANVLSELASVGGLQAQDASKVT